MVFVVPRLKSPAVCEECVGAIFRDSVHTSMKNRSSVGSLLGLPVDIDSILINGGAFRRSSSNPPPIQTFIILFFHSCSEIRLHLRCR